MLIPVQSVRRCQENGTNGGLMGCASPLKYGQKLAGSAGPWVRH